MSDQHEILPEVGGEPSTLQGRIGDTMVAVGGQETDAAFGNAASMHMESASTVQGRLKSPVGEDQANNGGGANGAKDTARPVELGGAGGQYSNDQEMTIEQLPPQKTQQQYPSNIPNGSNVHETSGGMAIDADTGSKADEGRGQDAATAAATAASTGAQPGSDAKTSRRSMRRLSSRSMTGDGDAASGPAQRTDLASDNNGGSTAQGDGASISVSCSYFRSHRALMMLAQAGTAAHILIGVLFSHRCNRTLIFLFSIRLSHPSLLLTLVTALIVVVTCIIAHDLNWRLSNSHDYTL